MEDTAALRPDGGIMVVGQRTVHFTAGYCQVKPETAIIDPIKTHEDLLRLAKF